MPRRERKNSTPLPHIPDRHYFTIGEASKLCAVKPHVLRYWEQEFQQLNPIKRRGNRRYYQVNDVLLARQIRALLYEQRFTIEGARVRLGEIKSSPPLPAWHVVESALSDIKQLLDSVL